MMLPSSQYAPVYGGCRCRAVPLRIAKDLRDRLTSLDLPPETPVTAYYCRSCREWLVLTAKHVGACATAA